ncbi:hypothetical protein [Kitasatospora sp. NPDC004289]
MADRHLPAPSSVRWLAPEETVRERLRTLVTQRQGRITGTPVTAGKSDQRAG